MTKKVITISGNNREGEMAKVHIGASFSHVQPWLRLYECIRVEKIGF